LPSTTSESRLSLVAREPKNGGAFWTSLPGLMTGAAALIAAVVGLYQVLHNGDTPSSSNSSSDGQVVSPPQNQTSAPPAGQAPSAGFTVDDAQIPDNTQPGSDQPVPCPAKLTFHGIITVSGSGTVTYQWMKGDEKRGPYRLSFPHGGAGNVTPLKFKEDGAPGEHIKEEVDLIATQPNVKSYRGFVDLTCQ
jgi:hypothetical protein